MDSIISLLVMVVLLAVAITIYFPVSKFIIRQKDSWLGAGGGRQEAPPVLPPTPDRAAGPVSNPTPEEEVTRPPEEVLRDILGRKYESVNIGGVAGLLETLPDAPPEEIAIIFEQVKDREALVNLAINGRASIVSVRLITVNPEPRARKFAVEMRVRNLTGKDLRVKIPKGQVFENKRPLPAKQRTQNLAAAQGTVIIIPASMGADSPGFPITLEALCINEGFKLPDGSAGNITIFELRNKTFLGQRELWDWLQEKIAESNDANLLTR